MSALELNPAEVDLRPVPNGFCSETDFCRVEFLSEGYGLYKLLTCQSGRAIVSSNLNSVPTSIISPPGWLALAGEAGGCFYVKNVKIWRIT